MSSLVETHLLQLRHEIALEHPTAPEELRKYLMEGDFWSLSKKESIASEDSKRLSGYLTRELTKIGYSLEEFLGKVK